jgi:hypothetical protein
MRKGLTIIIFSLFNLLLSAQMEGYGFDFVSGSVLGSGRWHKIRITNDGVYRIGYSKLAGMGFADPSKVRLYGNNHGQLSYFNIDPRPDDLVEIATERTLGQDGIFNEGDFIYFFAQGTHRWNYDYPGGKYRFMRHNYSDTSVYFLTERAGIGLSISPSPEITSPPDYTTDAYDALFIKEEETENIIKSGREWYQPVSVLKEIDVNPGFSELVPDEPVKYRLRVVGRSPVPIMFRVLSNGETLVPVMVPEVNMFNTTGTFAQYAESEGTFPYATNPAYEVRFYNNGESSARAWLDYLVLHGRARIAAGTKQLIFSDSRSTGIGIINEYRVKTSDVNLRIWDVTDPVNPTIVNSSWDGTFANFRAPADSLRRFVAFSQVNATVPVIEMQQLNNQDLHSLGPCDMIIVVHPWFIAQAERLAELHFNYSGLETCIVTPGQIYNEFSGGIADAAAIRNFVRMMWLKNSSSAHPLKYLLLFGDGSFENKKLPPTNPNFIPTWQTQNSNIVVSSFMSDDFYGLLDENEGEATGFLDIGIGRLPVSDTASASIVVDKIEKYIYGSAPGSWRSIVTLAADDEDGNLHMTDAENIASHIATINPSLNIDKIYFDAFRQETSVNGQSYPDATRAINNRIEQGTLILNYLGHGNELGLAHERVIKTVDINSWRNLTRLPLFITATCEFSRFDDAEYNVISGTWVPKTSAGELALLNPSGGAIALMSTTRVVYSAPNFVLNKNIYNFAFSSDAEGKPLRLGDIIRLAKINSGSSNNKRNFSLLGDPALILAYPSDGVVVTDSINRRHISEPADTLMALSEISVSGYLKGRDGQVMSDYNGMLYTTVYDKPVNISTLANDGGPVMSFSMINSILFSGKTSVTEGMFTLKFMVPRDIDYSYGLGKISYYAYGNSNNGSHASGYFNQITVGGFSKNTTDDTTGPEIKLFLNDTLFRNGGIASEDPYLLALISDENGINTTGAGIGHDLTLWLNGERNNSFVVNNFFEAEFDNYKKGSIRYPLANLKQGQNNLTIKAWDNYNNSSEKTLLFFVGADVRFIVSDILNYPNPFTSSTTIVAGHNRPDSNVEVLISIFDMSGRLIRTLRSSAPAGGYAIEPVIWDRTTDNGAMAGRGTYVFRIKLVANGKEIAWGSGRMIIL